MSRWQSRVQKSSATKVPLLLSFEGGQVSSVAIVGSCVEANSRRRRHDLLQTDTSATRSTAGDKAVRQGKPSSYVFALADDGRTLGWDSQSGDSSHESRACLPGKRITALDIHSEAGKTLLFLGSENGQCRAINIDTCNCVTVFKPHPPTSKMYSHSNSLDCVVKMNSQDGTLITGSNTGQICIWDVITGKLKRKWVSHNSQTLTSIQFATNEKQEDFRTVYSTGNDRSVRIWDVRLKNPEVAQFLSHRNTPSDVIVIDSVVYSCANSSQLMKKSSTVKTLSNIEGGNNNGILLPSLEILEHQLNRDRYYPTFSRGTMRDYIRQRLKRLPVNSKELAAIKGEYNSITNNISNHPLQQSVLASMPSSSNGLRPKGEFLLVHDLRSRTILRELNIVDSLTGIHSVTNASMFCSPSKGRRTVVLSGVTQSGGNRACCVNIDSGEMMYDLVMPISRPEQSRCTTLACTRATSSASEIVMGWDDGAFAAWSLDNVSAKEENAVWRGESLVASLNYINEGGSTPSSDRAKTLKILLKEVKKLRKSCESQSASRWTWSEWQNIINTLIAKSREAISMCMVNRSQLTSEELELSTLAATTTGMIPAAITLMKMHVRTGIGASDKLVASIMDHLPYNYHFGYGTKVVPKIPPLQSIGGKASVLIGEQCIQIIKASGRIPREDAISGFIRLLCRCGFVERAVEELKISRSRGLKPGRNVYASLLKVLLASGGNLTQMTSLLEEMIKHNIIPSESEFQMLTDANIVEKRYNSAREWLNKMIDSDCSVELAREVGTRLIHARVNHYKENRTSSSPKATSANDDLLFFCVNIAKKIDDLEHLLVMVLLLIHRQEEAYRLILKIERGGTPPSSNDLNQVMDYVSKHKSPQPEMSINYFNHVCHIAQDSVQGSTHACYMRSLLSASRVDLALKHFAFLSDKADEVALPPTVYNALLSAYSSSQDFVSFENTWEKMVANGSVDSHSFELLMGNHIHLNNKSKTLLAYEEFKKTKLISTPKILSFVISVQNNFRELQNVWSSTSAYRWKQSVTACIQACTRIGMKHLNDNALEILRWGADIYFAFQRKEEMITKSSVSKDTEENTREGREMKEKVISEKLHDNNTNISSDSSGANYINAVTDMINCLCHNRIREAPLAQKMLKTMKQPPPQCYGSLIDCFLTSGEYDLADKIVTELLEEHLGGGALPITGQNNGIRKKLRAMSAKIIQNEKLETEISRKRLSNAANNSKILQNVITGLANGGRAEAALRVANRCIERGFRLPQKNLWHSILKGAVSKNLLGQKCWNLMKRSAFVPDNETWTAFIRTKGSNSEATLSILRQMRSQRIVLSPENCSAILESQIADSNPEGTSMMLKIMHTRSMQIDQSAFCRMIQVAVSPMVKESLAQGIEILQFMRSSGARPDLRTCKAIFKATAKLGDATTAIMLMLQIQDTNKAKRGKAGGEDKNSTNSKSRIVRIDNDLCMSYVQSLIRGHELVAAIQFVREEMCAVGSGVVAGTAIWSMLLQGCARNHDIGKADEIEKEMKQRGIVSNRMGRCALALLFARFDRIQRALNILSLNELGTKIEWAGLGAAKQLLLAICRRLDKTNSQAVCRTSLLHICLVFRSSGQQHLSDLVAIAKISPLSIPTRLDALKEPTRRGWGIEDPECSPYIEELENYFKAWTAL